MSSKKQEKSHIAPDRLHRFMDDDESIKYQEFIPGPNSVVTPTAPVGAIGAGVKKRKG